MKKIPAIEGSVETFYWMSGAWNTGWPKGFTRREVFVENVQNQTILQLKRFGPKIARPYPALAENIIDGLIGNGVIEILENPVSGKYYTLNQPSLAQYRQTFLSGDDLRGQVEAVGTSLFDDIFSVYNTVDPNDIVDESLIDGVAPASDRVVNFNDNEEVFRSVTDCLAEFSEIARTQNDFGNLSEAEIDVARSEIGELVTAIASGSGRPKRLWMQARSTLGWIGQQAAGAVVGAAALALLALIFQLFQIYL